jgi:hypothetical protein
VSQVWQLFMPTSSLFWAFQDTAYILNRKWYQSLGTFCWQRRRYRGIRWGYGWDKWRRSHKRYKSKGEDKEDEEVREERIKGYDVYIIYIYLHIFVYIYFETLQLFIHCLRLYRVSIHKSAVPFQWSTYLLSLAELKSAEHLSLLFLLYLGIARKGDDRVRRGARRSRSLSMRWQQPKSIVPRG